MRSTSQQKSQSTERTPVDQKFDGPPETRPTTEQLILLSTFNNTHDAQLFRIELEQQGIKSHQVSNELTTSLFGATIAGPSSTFWIEVLVLESDVEKGLEIKNNTFDSKVNKEVDVPQWKCACGEAIDAGFAICWQCNADYTGTEIIG